MIKEYLGYETVEEESLQFSTLPFSYVLFGPLSCGHGNTAVQHYFSLCQSLGVWPWIEDSVAEIIESKQQTLVS